MRILAFLTHDPPSGPILRHLGLPDSSPLSPAPGPPQHHLPLDTEHHLDLDQMPAYDLTEPEPSPDFDFDQRAGA